MDSIATIPVSEDIDAIAAALSAPPALVEAETWRKAARYARDCAHERACQLDGFQGSAEAAGWIRCKQSEAERIAEWLEKQANQPSATPYTPPEERGEK